MCRKISQLIFPNYSICAKRKIVHRKTPTYCMAVSRRVARLPPSTPSLSLSFSLVPRTYSHMRAAERHRRCHFAEKLFLFFFSIFNFVCCALDTKRHSHCFSSGEFPRLSLRASTWFLARRGCRHRCVQFKRNNFVDCFHNLHSEMFK